MRRVTRFIVGAFALATVVTSAADVAAGGCNCPGGATACIQDSVNANIRKSPHFYAIFWKYDTDPSSYQAMYRDFLQHLGGTPYYGLVSGYTDASGADLQNLPSMFYNNTNDVFVDTTLPSPNCTFPPGCPSGACGQYRETCGGVSDCTFNVTRSPKACCLRPAVVPSTRLAAGRALA